VAKAYADIVLISGHDGGTGASPLSSVKNAGGPWELGLAEAHQVLLLNGLRNRVTLRTDGGMKTGIDILIAAMLGAEEFNFGTAALIATGCVYVRKCHLNTCPVGVTTQDEKSAPSSRARPTTWSLLQRRGRGSAAASRQHRRAHAQRSHRSHRFPRAAPGAEPPKANLVDLSRVLAMPKIDDGSPRFHTWERNDKLEDRTLDETILQDAKSCLQNKTKLNLKYKVKNTFRSIGTQLSGEIAYRYGDEGLPENTLNLALSGSAGQSLGAFLVKGVRITLTGESNDYVGKGMSGGEIIVVPSPVSKFDPAKNSICGNTVLYGATGGSLYIRGRAGERFAVRNSGATAVVEGIGDHGCEYMTNGRVVVLGVTGKNFARGNVGRCRLRARPGRHLRAALQQGDGRPRAAHRSVRGEVAQGNHLQASRADRKRARQGNPRRLGQVRAAVLEGLPASDHPGTFCCPGSGAAYCTGPRRCR
jgi:glutamate synthase domain-containing protein 3